MLKRLGIGENELVGYSIFRRSYDARKPSAITLIYTLDVEVAMERLSADSTFSAISKDARVRVEAS